ncbi:MAG TPA: hypothetical protein VGL94_19320, partial [Ktedonobacteraceae bacterium]
MQCRVCQTTPCQVLGGHLAEACAWLFSDEAEQMLNSGEWCSLFEHLTAHIREPEMETRRKSKGQSIESVHEPSHPASVLPSQEVGDYWIWAYSARPGSDTYNVEKRGKWLVFVPVIHVDAAWARIKEAVEEG